MVGNWKLPDVFFIVPKSVSKMTVETIGHSSDFSVCWNSEINNQSEME